MFWLNVLALLALVNVAFLVVQALVMRAMNMKIERVALGIGSIMTGTVGGVEYKLGFLPTLGYVSSPELLTLKPGLRRTVVTLLPWLILSLVQIPARGVLGGALAVVRGGINWLSAIWDTERAVALIEAAHRGMLETPVDTGLRLAAAMIAMNFLMGLNAILSGPPDHPKNPVLQWVVTLTAVALGVRWAYAAYMYA